MISLFGIVGSICFAVCGIPQVVMCIKQRSAKGLSWTFLILWLVGCIFSTIFVAFHEHTWPLLINYFFSFACALSISIVKLIYE